jgi:mycothiol system anti-sigma-R factor
MADCKKTLEELETFLDDELSESVRAEIHQHLDGCTDCQSAFEFHYELKVVIREKCQADELPAGLLSRLEQCLGEDFDGDGRIG